MRTEKMQIRQLCFSCTEIIIVVIAIIVLQEFYDSDRER